MAQSHLLRFVYNNGTDEVIRRGKKIHAIGFVEFIEHDELMGSVSFRVKDDHYSTFYKVYVQKYRDARAIMVRCTCPYNLGDICRHEVAALFQLQDMLDKNMLGIESMAYDQRHTVVKMKQIELKTIRMLTSSEAYEEAERRLRIQKANIVSAVDERVEALVDDPAGTRTVVLQKNEERNFDTSCNCVDEHHPLCVHKTTLFIQLLNAYGPHYFDTIRNWDKEKNKLLEAYGYSMKVEGWEKKFEFSYKDGKPFLRVLDPTVKRISPPTLPPRETRLPPPEPTPPPQNREPAVFMGKRLGVVFQEDRKSFPGFTLEVVVGECGEDGARFLGKVEKLDLQRFLNTDGLSEADTALFQLMRKLQASEIAKYVNRNSPFAGIWENIIRNEEEGLPAETENLIIEYIYPKLRKLFADFHDNALFFVSPAGKPLNTRNLQPVRLIIDTMRPGIVVARSKSGYEVCCKARLNEWVVGMDENEWCSRLVVKYDNALCLWDKVDDLESISELLAPEKNIFPRKNGPTTSRTPLYR